jgi:hypothetical protein
LVGVVFENDRTGFVAAEQGGMLIRERA